MGLATRIIPTLLARGDQLVKGQRFDSWRSVGHVLQAARVHASRGVDELVVLDIAATPERRGPNLQLVEKIAEAQFTPITVGGGVRSIADIRALLAVGADKVAIGTAAIENPCLVPQAAQKFGRQAIVVSIDAHRGWVVKQCGRFVTDIPVVKWAQQMALHGAGEILLTAVDRDGMLCGYDLDLVREVSLAVTVPVIAHGGCGTYVHMREAVEAGASGVAAGAMFQFTDFTPRGAAKYLAHRGIETRIP